MDAHNRVTPLSLLAAAVALAALGYGVSQTVDWLRVQDARGRVGASAQQRYGCLEKRLHQLVAPGTRVAIGRNSSLYQLSLIEWSTPALRIVANERNASVVLLVRHVSGGCDGYDVVVRRPA